MHMRASFDSRDHRHANIHQVFQNLHAFVVNLAPDSWIGDLPKDEKSIPGINSPPAPVRMTTLFARSCAIR